MACFSCKVDFFFSYLKLYWLCYAFNLDADKFSLTVYQQIIKESDFSGQSSDSEDLSALDSSSKCTAVKHANIPKPQKITRSPARISSPHIKDIEKDKHREKHQHSSPRTYKWTFQISKSSIEFNKYHSKATPKDLYFVLTLGSWIPAFFCVSEMTVLRFHHGIWSLSLLTRSSWSPRSSCRTVNFDFVMSATVEWKL